MSKYIVFLFFYSGLLLANNNPPSVLTGSKIQPVYGEILFDELLKGSYASRGAPSEFELLMQGDVKHIGSRSASLNTSKNIYSYPFKVTSIISRANIATAGKTILRGLNPVFTAAAGASLLYDLLKQPLQLGWKNDELTTKIGADNYLFSLDKVECACNGPGTRIVLNNVRKADYCAAFGAAMAAATNGAGVSCKNACYSYSTNFPNFITDPTYGGESAVRCSLLPHYGTYWYGVGVLNSNGSPLTDSQLADLIKNSSVPSYDLLEATAKDTNRFGYNPFAELLPATTPASITASPFETPSHLIDSHQEPNPDGTSSDVETWRKTTVTPSPTGDTLPTVEPNPSVQDEDTVKRRNRTSGLSTPVSTETSPGIADPTPLPRPGSATGDVSGGVGSGGGSSTSITVNVPDFCALHPNSVACLDVGAVPAPDPSPLTVQPVEMPFQPPSVAGSCPPNRLVQLIRGGTYELSYEPVCTAATTLRPLFIGLSGLTALFIVSGAFRKNA